MKVKKTPMRLCVACESVGSKRELLRIVRSPEGEVSIDLTGKKAGRGVYVCRTKECLEKAIKEKRLERGLRIGIDEQRKNALLEEFAEFEKK